MKHMTGKNKRTQTSETKTKGTHLETVKHILEHKPPLQSLPRRETNYHIMLRLYVFSCHGFLGLSVVQSLYMFNSIFLRNDLCDFLANAIAMTQGFPFTTC